MQKISTRFTWSLETPSTGGVIINLECLAADSDPKNKRSAQAGQKKTFRIVDNSVNAMRVNEHMLSLTDDQCDSCFPQDHAKKKKKDAE